MCVGVWVCGWVGGCVCVWVCGCVGVSVSVWVILWVWVLVTLWFWVIGVCVPGLQKIVIKQDVTVIAVVERYGARVV